MPRKPNAPAAAPKAAPAPTPSPAAPENGRVTVTNCLPGTQLTLDDGREIGHGESAEVSAEMAAFLRERGQVE